MGSDISMLLRWYIHILWLKTLFYAEKRRVKYCLNQLQCAITDLKINPQDTKQLFN